MGGFFQIIVPKSVQKDLRQIPLPWQKRIIKAIDKLQENPWVGDKMLGKLTGYYKIRVWPYRILYRIEEKRRLIVLVEVGHRGGIY